MAAVDLDWSNVYADADRAADAAAEKLADQLDGVDLATVLTVLADQAGCTLTQLLRDQDNLVSALVGSTQSNPDRAWNALADLAAVLDR